MAGEGLLVVHPASSSNSDGVAFSRRRYSQLDFITINKQKKLAAVTPLAKRNTYSVAIIFSHGTQGRGAPRLNPGLCNRNSYRVAKGAYHPLQTPSRISPR